MRLVSFTRVGDGERILGALDGDRILDLGAAAAVVAPGLDSGGRLRSLDALLQGWDQGLPLARTVLDRASRADGAAREALASAWRPRSRITLQSPVSRPGSFRDFYAFEDHVKNARGRRGLPVPPEW